MEALVDLKAPTVGGLGVDTGTIGVEDTDVLEALSYIETLRDREEMLASCILGQVHYDTAVFSPLQASDSI